MFLHALSRPKQTANACKRALEVIDEQSRDLKAAHEMLRSIYNDLEVEEQQLISRKTWNKLATFIEQEGIE